MKRKTRNITICVLTGCMALTGATAFAACNNGGKLEFPPYDYDYDKTEDFGDGIVLDGKLDEAQWQGKRVLDADVRNTNCVFRMTSYYGEKGVYFGFDITDDAVYFNKGTLTEINSGVQFCVGSNLASGSGVVDCTYRISLNAGGVSLIRKWISPSTATNDGFVDWTSNLHSKVWMNGEINGECEGYSIELYLPYSMFHSAGDANKDEKPDTLYVSPALVRAASPYATSDWSQRLWYSIGENERGIGWNYPASNWYRFGENGLVAEDVNIVSGANGKIEGKSWCIAGDVYRMTVKPDEGYVLSALKVNGKEQKDTLFYRDGVAYCEVKASGALTIQADFEALPQTVHTLSGTVSVTGGDQPDIVMYAARGGAYVPISVENGSYSVQLARGEWAIISSATGYLVKTDEVNLVADMTKNIVIGKNYIRPDNADEWDLTDLGAGTVLGISGGWMVSARHTEIESNSIFMSGRIVVPVTEGADTRVGFSLFCGSSKIFVCLLANGERGANSYGMQVIVTSGGEDQWGNGDVSDLETSIGKEIRALASEDGIPLAVEWKEGKLSVWINGTCVRNAVALDGKYGFTADTEFTPGLTTCNGRGAYYGLEFTGEGTGAFNGTLRDKDGVALSGVTVTLTPINGNEITQTTGANGAYDFGSLPVGNYTFTVEAENYNKYSADFFVTPAGVVKDITLTAYSAGADLILSGSDYFDYSEIADGKIVYNYFDKVYSTMSHELTFRQKVKAGDDFYIAITSGKQDTFVMDDEGGISYGFRFVDANGRELIARFLYDRAHNNWALQFTNWNDLWSGKDFGASAPETWENGTGFRFGVARIGGTFQFFMEDENGVEKSVLSETRSPLNNSEITVSLISWTQAQGAEFTEFVYNTGKIPVDVVKSAVENGTVEVSANPVIGGNITITLTPANGYLPETLIVNGENRAANLSKDGVNYVLTLNAYAAKTLKISATFVEEQVVDVTLTFTGIADGTLVTLKGANGSRTANVTGGKAVFDALEKGSYTVSVDGYQDATVEITAAGEKQVTLKEIDMNAVMQDKYVETEGENYDLSKIESEKKIVYKGTSGESHLKFKASATASQDFWLESTLNGSAYNGELPDGGYRFGFTLFPSSANSIHVTIVRWDATWRVAINNWGDIDINCPMTAAQAAAFIGNDGLRFVAARINGTLYVFADDGAGNLVRMLETTNGGIGNGTVNLGFATWWQAKGLEYKNFKYVVGDIPVEVTKNTPEHGTLSVPENVAMGDNVTITLTPESGYIVSAFTVNGTSRATELTKNNGVYTYTLSNVLSDKLNVQATFVENSQVNVTLKFSGISDGTKVTLQNASNSYEVTVTNGTATLSNAVKGTYTASAVNCHSAEVTLSQDGNVAVGLTPYTKNELMAERYVESGAENFDVSGYEDGQIVYTSTVESYMTLKKKIGANEDMFISTRIHAQNTFADDVSFGYVFKAANGANLICRFTHDVANSNWLIQLTNWGSFWGGHLLTAEQLALYNGADGLYFGIARIGGKICIYIEQNGVVQLVNSTDYADLANQEITIQLVAWGSAKGAEYNDFAILSGKIPVTVNKSTSANGSVEVSENPVLGGNIAITLTPDEGYTLSEVTVNGALVTATQNKNAYTVSVNNYVASRTLNVSATFVERKEYDVTLQFDGVADGTQVTLQSVSNTYTVTVSEGKATLSGAIKGTYTASAEHFFPSEVVISEDGEVAVGIVARTLVPYNFRLIGNAESGFKTTEYEQLYADQQGTKYDADDLTKFSTDGGSVKWSKVSSEILWFKNLSSKLTIEVTVKANISKDGRVTVLAVYAGGMPFVCDICQVTEDSYSLRIESHWGFGEYWDDNSVLLSEAQMNAIKTTGLSMKIVREELKFEWFVDTCEDADTVNYELKKSMDFSSKGWKSGTAPCGMGVSASAAEFTNIRITGEE